MIADFFSPGVLLLPGECWKKSARRRKQTEATMRSRAKNPQAYLDTMKRFRAKRGPRKRSEFEKKKAAAVARAWRAKNREHSNRYARERRLKLGDRALAVARAWRERNSERLKLSRAKWMANNPDKVRASVEKFRSKITDEYRSAKRHKSALYREKNREALNAASKAWTKKNRQKVNDYIKRRKAKDQKFRFTQLLRSRIRKALWINKKQSHFVELIGASVEFVRGHLESQFTDGMSWENYGSKGWVVDHIIPCASFDLSLKEEQLKCFHYSNLQPLWARENIQKGSKMPALA